MDDGTHVYLFYTSSKTNHIRRTVPDGLSVEQAIDINPVPTPNSRISAVLPQNNRIVLFFQSLNDAEGTVELYGITFSRPAAAATGPWAASKEVKIAG